MSCPEKSFETISPVSLLYPEASYNSALQTTGHRYFPVLVLDQLRITNCDQKKTAGESTDEHRGVFLSPEAKERTSCACPAVASERRRMFCGYSLLFCVNLVRVILISFVLINVMQEL